MNDSLDKVYERIIQDQDMTRTEAEMLADLGAVRIHNKPIDELTGKALKMYNEDELYEFMLSLVSMGVIVLASELNK